ncbi:MAG TPA: site-2 protease family protein [Micromonosporaceae bacterium]|jgi:membrane-associated protease RseP (regulator of RpoE activity)
MAYILGVVLFALAILISVCLHEAGHMATAKAFGMKVTRYFVGFGPTLWSIRRGETEYGIKGVPLGGFVKIVGMTPQDDDVAPEDERRAMWRFPVWKRTIVMSAGSVTHFALAFIALWFAAIFMGLPNPAYPTTQAEVNRQPAVIKVATCVIADATRDACAASDPASPSSLAGLKDGDRITRVGGTPVNNYGELVNAIRSTRPGPVVIEYVRNSVSASATLNLISVQRPPLDNRDGPLGPVSAMGVMPKIDIPASVKYGPSEAFGASADFTGTMFTGTVEAMKKFPEKVPKLWTAINGGQRDPQTPISVVGASRLGGEAVANNAWEAFVFLFITLNFFVGVFNLLPLLPLDGGHIAIAWFERARSWVYARLGRADPGRVDYFKLMPVTYAVILIFGAFTLLTVTADVVNPITLFSR